MAKTDTTKQPTGLALYNLAAHRAAREVIYSYSTSFGFATRLLGKDVRHHVENIYAMVRVADEIVDGSAAEASALAPGISVNSALDEFEAETYRAMECGYSTNLILHAFGITAREVGVEREIVRPFFESMRADITEHEHTPESFKRYVYGSAEVVGLMCLRAFMHGLPYSTEQRATLENGACALGSAFQKVNFLRDLSADFKRLGRSYFPDVNVANFDEATKIRLVADIDSDLKIARASLSLLPKSARAAVAAALLLFAELNRKLSKTPASELIQTRIRVGNFRKLWLVLKAKLGVNR